MTLAFHPLPNPPKSCRTISPLGFGIGKGRQVQRKLASVVSVLCMAGRWESEPRACHPGRDDGTPEPWQPPRDYVDSNLACRCRLGRWRDKDKEEEEEEEEEEDSGQYETTHRSVKTACPPTAASVRRNGRYSTEQIEVEGCQSFVLHSLSPYCM